MGNPHTAPAEVAAPWSAPRAGHVSARSCPRGGPIAALGLPPATAGPGRGWPHRSTGWFTRVAGRPVPADARLRLGGSAPNRLLRE